MKRSVITALVIAVAATGWILSGQVGSSGAPAETRTSATVPPAAALPQVRVQTFTAHDHTVRITLTGRTQAVRRVDLRAETEGPIAEIFAAEGAVLRKGDRIARIALKDREARLAEARALVAQRQAVYEASARLAEKGYRARTALAQDRALLDQARALLKQVEVDIASTILRAPFEGVLERRAVELGDFVQRGDEIATIVDLDPILVLGDVAEADVGTVEVGMPARVRLVTGDTLDATVRYIATTADPDTRTFRIELEADNPDRRIREGLTAELVLPGRTVRAHLVSPALLTLADDGRIGVKLLTEGDVARFAPVRILGETPEGVWLAGLPERATLVTVGQAFVKDGERVAPVPVTAETAS